MSIFVYVIAATVLCAISLAPDLTQSIEIIAAYDEDDTEFVNKSLQEGWHSFNKSHRFYFTLGERIDGKRYLHFIYF